MHTYFMQKKYGVWCGDSVPQGGRAQALFTQCGLCTLAPRARHEGELEEGNPAVRELVSPSVWCSALQPAEVSHVDCVTP